MKKLIIGKTFVIMALGLFSGGCDKVDNAYIPATDLDHSLYPGEWSNYVANEWPVFEENTNTERNVMIEDFTGQVCVYCPAQTAFMENLIHTNPERIFGVAIHAGPTGLTTLQQVDEDHPTVFYNDQGLELGTFFGAIAGSSFIGNPAFTVNRLLRDEQYTSSAGSITTPTNTILASELKVNIQAGINYYASTRGLFVHTEIDKIDAGVGSIGAVVYLVEDSLISPQTIPNADDPDGSPGNPGVADGLHQTYVHRDIMRGCIDGKAFGRTLTDADLDANGKYYLNYSYRLPDQYNPENMHLLIYVYDKVTLEIYQVISEEITN